MRQILHLKQPKTRSFPYQHPEQEISVLKQAPKTYTLYCLMGVFPFRFYGPVRCATASRSRQAHEV